MTSPIGMIRIGGIRFRILLSDVYIYNRVEIYVNAAEVD